jgi:hypothetical protein
MTTYTPTFSLFTAAQNFDYETQVASINIYGGRTDVFTQPTPRVLTAQLINYGGGGSSFVPPSIGEIIKCTETVLGVTLFYGIITDITFSYSNYVNGNGLPNYTVTAVAHLATIDWNTVTPATYAVGPAGEQILSMLNNWQMTNLGSVTYSSSTIPQTGGATIGSLTTVATDNLGDIIRYTADSAGGVFYEKADGTIYYDRRVDRANRSAITLTNDDIMSDITFTKSITAIGNDCTVQLVSGTRSASDSTSVGKFGKRAGTRSTRLQNTSDALTLAQTYIAAFKSPVWRPNTVTLSLHNPNMTNTVRSQIAQVFCGTKVTIPIPSDIGSGTDTYFVENFTLQTGKGTLDVSLGLCPTADSI